jgi:hypothetical protein
MTLNLVLTAAERKLLCESLVIPDDTTSAAPGHLTGGGTRHWQSLLDLFPCLGVAHVNLPQDPPVPPNDQSCREELDTVGRRGGAARGQGGAGENPLG